MVEGCIYLLTAPNGKPYVGLTWDFPKRLVEHQSASKNPSVLIHKAIKKYGWENFSSKVLFTTTDEETLKQKEREFIAALNTHYLKGFGYNMTDGGDGQLGFRFSSEQREQLSKSHIGKKHSEESKKKMSLVHKGHRNTAEHNKNISNAIQGHPGYRKNYRPWTEEERQNLSRIMKGKKHPKRKRTYNFTEEHRRNLRLAQQKRREREKNEACNS